MTKLFSLYIFAIAIRNTIKDYLYERKLESEKFCYIIRRWE